VLVLIFARGAAPPPACRAVCRTSSRLVEFVDKQVKDTFHGRSALIAAGADHFCWVFLWNAMDLVPVDALPSRKETRCSLPAHGAVDRPQRHLWAIAIGAAVDNLHSIKIMGPLGYAGEFSPIRLARTFPGQPVAYRRAAAA
jgi:hypothetical protein